MAKTLTNKPRRKEYPTPVRTRSGNKVGWYYYDKRIDAERCSKAAEYNADIFARAGYDFGYCTPGSIRVLSGGQFEVCIP